ncbi:hypothetical protein FRB91_004694 [Serendipita sp. 411]|nr:hypothetical protein FRB91_004694 [Serendipita sp. 411]
MYDWVAQNPNIIAVSMNYRLHLFGFLDGTAVRADGTPNAGLLDQRAAIEWVRRHISQFGGDPDQITIAGESAGGASVVLQATAYGGVRQAPFKRAIAQSIGLYPLPLDSEIEGVFRNVTTAASCPTEGTEAMACLRSAPLSTLIKSINSVRTNFLAPTIDVLASTSLLVTAPMMDKTLLEIRQTCTLTRILSPRLSRDIDTW